MRGVCLPPAMSRAERRLVEKVVSEALNGLDGDLAGKYYPLATMAQEDQHRLIEVGMKAEFMKRNLGHFQGFSY